MHYLFLGCSGRDFTVDSNKRSFIGAALSRAWVPYVSGAVVPHRAWVSLQCFWQHAQRQMLSALVRTLVQTTTCTSALAAHVVSPSVRVFMLCGRCARIPLVHDNVKHKLL